MKAAPKPAPGPGEPGNIATTSPDRWNEAWFGGDDNSGGGGSGFQLGSANNDQFATGGWGTQNREGERSTPPVSRNTVRGGQRVGPDLGGTPTAPRTSSPGLEKNFNFPTGGGSTLSSPMPSVGKPRMGIQPGDQVGVRIPTINPPSKPGGKPTWEDPDVGLMDRAVRGVQGMGGPKWTGNKWVNAGANTAIGFTPAAPLNSAIGVGQGIASNSPVTREWKGGTWDPSVQGDFDPSKLDKYGRPIAGAKGEGPRTVAGAEEEALRDTLGGSPSRGYSGEMGGIFGGFAPSMLPSDGGGGGGGDYATQLPAEGGGGGGVSDADRENYRKLISTGLSDEQRARLEAGEPIDDVMVDDGEEGVEGPDPASQEALDAIFKSGQQYQTDGSGGRVGVAGAGGGNYSYAGFDFAQDPANRDIGKSAKYAFSHLAGLAAKNGIPQPRSKEEAEAWFSQNIKAGMDQLGFTVHKVQGDKAFISAPEHPEGAWVDFQGNSGGQGDQPLTWQAEMGTSMETNPEDIFAVQDWGGGGGGGEAMGMDRGAAPGVLDSGNNSLNSFADRLVAQLVEGAAVQDATSAETRRRGITPESLAAVGF